MRLQTIHCRSFRCLTDVRMEPGPGLNIIRGGNAQGKTTLLEAVLFAATTKSHRTQCEEELAQTGSDAFHVDIAAQARDRDIAIETHWWNGAKRFKVNGVPQSRLSDILGRIHVVFFAPEDIALIKGGGGGRRRFLDMELSQVDCDYLAALQQYRHCLRQRNELLRQSRPDPEMISVWDVPLAAHANLLIAKRRAYVEELSRHAAQAHELIGGGEQLHLAYRPDVRKDEDIADVLARTRDNDLRRGQTTRGPHRDDLELTIAERPARSHGSQGQQKTAALALRLAELNLVRERTGEYPVLMLDEVLAELDAQRATLLFKAIPAEVQCLATATDRTPLEDQFDRPAHIFTMKEGNLEEAR